MILVQNDHPWWLDHILDKFITNFYINCFRSSGFTELEFTNELLIDDENFARLGRRNWRRGRCCSNCKASRLNGKTFSDFESKADQLKQKDDYDKTCKHSQKPKTHLQISTTTYLWRKCIVKYFLMTFILSNVVSTTSDLNLLSKKHQSRNTKKALESNYCFLGSGSFR